MTSGYFGTSVKKLGKSNIEIRRSNLIALCLLLVIVAIPIFTAIRAIDFGDDGDETVWINAISESVKKSTFLPDKYNYPSLTYDLGLITLLPYAAFTSWGHNRYDPSRKAGDLISDVLNDLSQRALDKEYRLILRSIFVILSSLSIIWIYLLVLKLHNSQFEALVSAALLAGSWEINYQSRHIVPNALLMQFGVLTFMFIIFSDKAENQSGVIRYRRIASIAAGLAFGAKYQGALFLMPVLFTAVLSEWHSSLKKWPWHELAILVLMFLVTFLITTPGAVLQIPIFIHDVGYEALHYSVYGHGAHTVTPGIQHLQLMLDYFGREALSNSPFVSFSCALISIVGIYAVWRKNRQLVLILLSLPVIYVIYMSRQRVMFIRNLLLVFPFLAIFAACGIGAILEYKFIKYQFIRISVLIIIGIVCFANALWLFKAADLILNPVQTSQIELLATYIDQRPSTHFYLSHKVLDDLLSFDGQLPSNIVHEAEEDAEYAYYGSELFDILSPIGKRPLINRSDFYTYLAPSGALNLNYVDVSPNNIVILETWKLTEMGIRPLSE